MKTARKIKNGHCNEGERLIQDLTAKHTIKPSTEKLIKLSNMINDDNQFQTIVTELFRKIRDFTNIYQVEKALICVEYLLKCGNSSKFKQYCFNDQKTFEYLTKYQYFNSNILYGENIRELAKRIMRLLPNYYIHINQTMHTTSKTSKTSKNGSLASPPRYSLSDTASYNKSVTPDDSVKIGESSYTLSPSISKLSNDTKKHNEEETDNVAVFHDKFAIWLRTNVGLGQYLIIFESMGCADIRLLRRFDDATLHNIGITNPWHRKLIMDKVKVFEELQNQFNELINKHDVLRAFKQMLKKNGVLRHSDLKDIPNQQILQKILNLDSDDDRIAEIWDIMHPSSSNQRSKNNEPEMQDKFDKIPQVKRIKDVMKIMQMDLDTDIIDINRVLNDFMYLSVNYNDKFEQIYDALGTSCNIEECSVFKRKYNEYNEDYGSKRQIFDKIHCYYLHSFDIGYRMTSQELLAVNSLSDDDEKEMDDIDEMNKYLINRNTLKMYNILQRKNRITDINTTQQRLIARYHQLRTSKTHSIEKDGKFKMYSFGTEFCYDGDTENDEKAMKISAKYASFKQELITNEIATISVKQFDNELEKAEMHYNTDYRKQNYSDMCIDNILSLMVYCNFDELQRHFSQTYRKNIEKHCNFYHLGRLLKISIHEFGTTINDGNVKSFYHGIGGQLAFPSIILNVRIYCPLSTSSSFTVATNFTNFNDGMVIQLGSVRNGTVKYFSVSWLSDYGNEEEHLFIQNEGWMQINDIVCTKLGYQYNGILNALKIIETITTGGNIYDYSICSFVKKIIQHRLSYKISKFKPFTALNHYAKRLISTYCKNKKTLKINFIKKDIYLILNDLLVNEKKQWIDIYSFVILFPYMELMEIDNITLNRFIMEDIYEYLKNINKNCNLIRIVMKVNTNQCNALDISSAIDKYEHKFMTLGFGIHVGKYNGNRMYIDKLQ